MLGIVPWEERQRLAQRIGTLFGQRSLLWLELTPRQSYRMLAAIYGLDRAAEQRRVAELGELLDATDLFDQPVRNLSLGQRMRCELAACLLHDPEILFLDEPTIGLDLVAKQRFRELLVRLNEQQGTTIFLTSATTSPTSSTSPSGPSSSTTARSSTTTRSPPCGAPCSPPRSSRSASPRRSTCRRATASRLLEHTDHGDEARGRHAHAPTSARCSTTLLGPAVADISVVDPPLEQVIAEIYELPAR